MKMDGSAAWAAMSGSVPSSGDVKSFAGSEAAQSAALGKNAKYVDPIRRRERHKQQLSAKWKASNILKSFNENDAKRVSHCAYVARKTMVELQKDNAENRASFDGVKTCGSVWWCPCCAPRIAEKRKGELDTLLAGARAEGLAVVMLTLTARHKRLTQLGPFLDGLKAAKKRMRQRKDWRALPLVGSVTATEVTHGANGWHPHFHEILVLKAAPAEALALVENLRGGWLRSLQAFGLEGNDAAFDVQDASAAGAYVAKFGAAEEMALSGKKKGRKGSRTPWQLLDDARDGDAQAAAIWAEYAAAFKGRRQLVWSNGLKARFGVNEVSDEEAAAEADAETAPQRETLRVWVGKGDWKQARRRRCALLFAAETGGCLDRAEFGPTDSERWRAEPSGDVVE